MNYFFKYKNKIIISLLVILFLITIVCIYFIFNKHDIKTDDLLYENVEFSDSVLEDNNILKFNIKGAVVNPGVYEFKEGERVIDAINKSGGLLENADTSVINLSKNLFDEMVIRIYTIEEINNMQKQNVVIEYVIEECNCPELSNDACINNSDNAKNKVSINTASVSELQTLDGIGKSKAEAIVKYREENGNFLSIEDIMKVSGIGQAAFDKIKENISV